MDTATALDLALAHGYGKGGGMRQQQLNTKGEQVMFVVIYTPGPAWLEGKPVTEQPFFREHISYMQQVFAARQLLMGGAFLDNQGGLGILDGNTDAQELEIVLHDPFVLARVVASHLHPWHAYFDQSQVRSAPSGS